MAVMSPKLSPYANMGLDVGSAFRLASYAKPDSHVGFDPFGYRFQHRQHGIPVSLPWVDIMMQHLLEHSVHTLGLTSALRVISNGPMMQHAHNNCKLVADLSTSIN